MNELTEQMVEEAQPRIHVRVKATGVTGRIRRKVYTPGDDRYIVDYDGSTEGGFHSPQELEIIR